MSSTAEKSGGTPEKKTSLLASGTRLSILTLFSRILGLVREMTKASLMGTSALADAFNVAFMIPNLLRRLFAENSISVAFIPTFRGYLEDTEKTETQEFLSATFTLITFLTSITVVLGIIAAPWFIPLFAGKNGGALPSEMTLLTRIMFPYLLIIAVAAFFQGILNGLRIFSPSGFTPILFNTAVIGLTYLLTPLMKNPARAMAIGVVAGGLIQALFQLPFVIRKGWKISFSSINRAFSNPGTRKVLKLVGPTIIGMAAYQLNDVVSTALAGRAGPGIVSSLQYSLRLQELILGIFAVSIGTVILPDLSALAKRADWDAFNKMLTRAMNIIALITIPITFFALMTGENIIILVFKNNRFTEESVRLTLEAFNWHIAGLFFIALNRIISPAFYAQGNTKSPTLAGIIGFGVNIILALALITPMKGSGIALALSAASFANTAALFVFLKKNKTVDVPMVIRSTLAYSFKMIIFSVIAVIPIWFFKNDIFLLFTGHNRIISQGAPLALCAVIFAAAGMLLLLVTRDPLTASVIGSLKNRKKK